MEEKDSREKWKFINNTCRLCSSKCHTKSKNIMQKKILEMIEKCSSLQPSAADGLPTKICSSCLQSLNICFRFRKKIETTDVLLRKKFKLLPKKDILDIALKEADVKNLQNKVICSDFEFIDEKNSASINDLQGILKCYLKLKQDEEKKDIQNNVTCNGIEYTGTFRRDTKISVSNIDVEDILKCYSMLKKDEEKKITHMLKQNSNEPDEEKTKVVSYNYPLPPLVPIELKENTKSIASTQILQEELPPLIPLITNSSESPSNMISEPVESSENTENLLKNQDEICEPSKILFCNICKKEYKERKKLIGHLKGHMVPKNFVCKICGKKYPNPSTFQIHMRTHTGERPFKCPVCKKGFTRWAGVVSHMQTHEENRPFKCDTCSQSFKILSNLERHKGLHAGVLPFCCNYCGKTFSQSANLQLHIRTYHTKERPYLCSECGKGFVSSTRLNRHMWVHTGYKPFHCKICSKGYSNSCDFKNHVSGAHGNGESEKPFCCNLCDKRFFYSCRLNKHFKTHHRSKYSNKTVDSGSNSEKI